MDCNQATSTSAVMTRNGYIGCKVGLVGRYRAMTREHDCAQFVRVTDAVAQTRAEWSAKVVGA